MMLWSDASIHNALLTRLDGVHSTHAQNLSSPNPVRETAHLRNVSPAE